VTLQHCSSCSYLDEQVGTVEMFTVEMFVLVECSRCLCGWYVAGLCPLSSFLCPLSAHKAGLSETVVGKSGNELRAI